MSTPRKQVLDETEFFSAWQADGDDPREFVAVNVSDLLVDSSVQRTTTEARLDRMGPVDWSLMEGITVTRRKDGSLVVTEGQHRVLLLQRQNPGARLVVIFNSADDEAGVALRIASTRRGHTPYDKWQLRLHQGELLETRAEQVLAGLGLRLFGSSSQVGVNSIAAVGAVERIMRMHGSSEADIEDGARLLDTTLSVLTSVWGPHEPGRLDGHLILAIGRIIARNDNIKLDRLAQRLGAWTAASWLKRGAERLPRQTKDGAIGAAIIASYNRQLTTANEIRW